MKRDRPRTKRASPRGKKPDAPKGKPRLTIADLPPDPAAGAVRGGVAADDLSAGSFGTGETGHQCFVPGSGVMRD